MTQYMDNDMKKHNVALHKQLGFRFAAARKSKKVQIRGLHLTVADVLVNIDNAFNVKTVNFKKLSQYVCEDVLGLEEGTPFLLCITKKLDVEFNKLLSFGAKEQCLLKLTGGV